MVFSLTFRKSLDLLSVQNYTGPKWHKKSDLAFWRGRDSRRERLSLVKMSDKYPDIIDAKLTAMFFFRKEQDDFEITKHVSFFDFFRVCMIFILSVVSMFFVT